MDILSSNIQNAYLTADCREQVWVAAGPKFGSESVKNILMRKVLCVLKSSGAEFREFLAETLDSMGYIPSYSDPDLWLQTAVKLEGFEYYEYIICYINNVLCVSHNPHTLAKLIQLEFKLKDKKIEYPEVYLGASLDKMKLESGNCFLTMLPEQHLKAAIISVEEYLARNGKRLPSNASLHSISIIHIGWRIFQS